MPGSVYLLCLCRCLFLHLSVCPSAPDCLGYCGEIGIAGRRRTGAMCASARCVCPRASVSVSSLACARARACACHPTDFPTGRGGGGRGLPLNFLHGEHQRVPFPPPSLVLSFSCPTGRRETDYILQHISQSPAEAPRRESDAGCRRYHAPSTDIRGRGIVHCSNSHYSSSLFISIYLLHMHTHTTA